MSVYSEQQPLLSNTDDPEVGEVEHRISSPTTAREKLAQFLESPGLHILVLALIALDAVCVLVDLGYSFLSEGCSPPEGPDAPVWMNVLANISLAITTVFLVEIPLALWAFGFRYYIPFKGIPHAPLHLFDAVIIITTFTLEFILKGRERELVGLLIILRLWRLVKLVGGIAVGAGEVEEGVAKELEDTRRQLEGVTIALNKARDENRKLRSRITWLETGGSEGEEPSATEAD
ncbi:hypothetical protein CONPUDRAFT_69967 [Coniophora puteana RWD-64-598 SS2]|uniref:Voltage-gated hydrogen channel 1 n=1 Tax=Coniophora puteana (strain RWD-64-598) TaxID=741705 RepID=A0A5M3N163_CONPW|nr:uncharacterized protein CONPUDRAFT_69967 [Coniophora puteana RWD-64-598 SS2]EIW85036.1 hypothetical protein CONPUDRAFT_69967 [Coniophora puteana RWD-64-598 SS2]